MPVIDTIKTGYIMPPIASPKAVTLPNNHSVLNNANFVTKAVAIVRKSVSAL